LLTLFGFLLHFIDQIRDNLCAADLRRDRGRECRGIDAGMQEIEVGVEATCYGQRRGEGPGIRIVSSRRDENRLDYRISLLPNSPAWTGRPCLWRTTNARSGDHQGTRH
jgi:hypothetical protein